MKQRINKDTHPDVETRKRALYDAIQELLGESWDGTEDSNWDLTTMYLASGEPINRISLSILSSYPQRKYYSEPLIGFDLDLTVKRILNAKESIRKGYIKREEEKEIYEANKEIATRILEHYNIPYHSGVIIEGTRETGKLRLHIEKQWVADDREIRFILARLHQVNLLEEIVWKS